jgi:hypothetical protein
MKHDGFLLLCVKSKVQNVVVIVGCIQNLKTKHKSKAKKKCVEHLGLGTYLSNRFLVFSGYVRCIQNQVEPKRKI